MAQLINRELSWLAFNERVLQEAMDKDVPLAERMRYLGIYSNNMDEFYRVRVANLRRMIEFNKKSVDGYKGSTSELYNAVRKTVLKQLDNFEKAYEDVLIALQEKGIYQLDESNCSVEMKLALSSYFELDLKHAIFPIILEKKTPFPRLRDSGIYLAIKMSGGKTKKSKFALIQIPTEQPRIYTIKDKEKQYFILLDDIIRLHLREIFAIFDFENFEAFTFKFTRDAELDLDDDLSVSFIEKIQNSLKQRKKGKPVRFVYDDKMPKDLLDFLLAALNIQFGVNTIPGGKYHNFKDFMSFPTFGRKELRFKKQVSVAHPELENQRSLIEMIGKKDFMLHFPYQRFGYIVDLLREAAIDPYVSKIKINIYRVTANSQIMKALMAAIYNGKEVTVIFELQARFDEENNLYWSNRLKETGAKVFFGHQNLKVHSKLLQITRKKGSAEKMYTYVGTGNFNERTAKVYTDLALLTSDPAISREVKKVFRLLESNYNRGVFKELLVSPFDTRKKLLELIKNEISIAKKGNKAYIKIKLNNLTDAQVIEMLYEASQAGVKIQMIIRGICSLVPGVKKISENIEVISIVDRYLEHSRFMIFGNNGDPRYFISSADFMERNIDKRIEVGAPIYSKELQEELETIFSYQWRGNVKSRIISKTLKNKYRKTGEKRFHAQEELYNYYLKKSLTYEDLH